MSENKNRNKAIACITPETRELIQQKIDKIFDADSDDALPLAENLLQTLDRNKTGKAFEVLQSTLQAAWNFFYAITLIKKENNFIEANKLFQFAADGFDQIGNELLKDLSVGMNTYTAAIIEMGNLNVSRSLELLTEAKNYLRRAGKYSRAFEPMIEHIEPDQFFIAGVQALQKLEFVEAESLIEKASYAAEEVARKYYKEGTPFYFNFLGAARLYKAVYTSFLSLNYLDQFEYDKLVAEQNLAKDAIHAYELLNKGDLKNQIIRNNINIANALARLLEVIDGLARIMQMIFHSTYRPNLENLALLKQKISIANNSAAHAGEKAVTFVKFCNQLSARINNLEKLATSTVNPYFGQPTKSTIITDIFVLMPFLNDFKPIYDTHIKNVTNSLMLTVERADDFFATHAIISDIWAAICAARVIVADCTKRNPNVFYEIGLAHAIGKPVILITQNSKDIPFDISHLRHIKYEYTPPGMNLFEQNLKEALKAELNP